MDYEKKYKEALELMKDCVPDENGLVHVRPCDIFTELEESEDEKIRGKIIATIHLYYGEPLEDGAKEMIAWLENQGEKRSGCSLMEAWKDMRFINWLKSLRPQNRWKPSEKQKEALLWCVVHLGGSDKQTLGELLEELNKL